jgi:hypothetical protein
MRGEQGTHPSNDPGAECSNRAPKDIMKAFTEEILQARLRILPVASE